MRAAVLGAPIAHSLSPVLHRAAYAALGLTGWRYDAVEVGDADGLRAFLAGLDEQWAGLSLTMPLKAVAVDLCDEVSPVAAGVRAVNTVLLAGGRRVGLNTDVPGLANALDERGVPRGGPVSVLGGGATARSALAALGGRAPRATVYARRPAAVEVPPGAPPAAVRPWEQAPGGLAAPLVVVTTPPGAADGLVAAVPERPGVLFDVTYAPWPTPLAAAWAAAGGRVVSGLDLLVHQAALQVEHLTGRRPAPLAAMRAAGEAALGR